MLLWLINNLFSLALTPNKNNWITNKNYYIWQVIQRNTMHIIIFFSKASMYNTYISRYMCVAILINKCINWINWYGHNFGYTHLVTIKDHKQTASLTVVWAEYIIYYYSISVVHGRANVRVMTPLCHLVRPLTNTWMTDIARLVGYLRQLVILYPLLSPICLSSSVVADSFLDFRHRTLAMNNLLLLSGVCCLMLIHSKFFFL